MTIAVGEKIPSAKLKTMTAEGPKDISTDDIYTGDKVLMLADGAAAFTKQLGLDLDLTGPGMGVRSKRYAMLVDNGTVKALQVEAPGAFEVSSADAILKAL